MKLHHVIQGSLDWELLRAGKITASELDNLLTPKFEIRTGQMPKTYLHEKIAEAWSGSTLPKPDNIWNLDQGTFLEDFARPAFTFETGLETERVGFVTTDNERTGCSPDGIIMGQSAGLELKSPHLQTHIGYLLEGKVPEKYLAQVHGSMFVTGFPVWYFASYRKQLPLLVVKVERDEKIQSAIKQAVSEFLEKMDLALAKLEKINGGPSPIKRQAFTPTTSTPKPEPKPFVSTDPT